MTQSDLELSPTFHEGQEAFRNGLGISDNPYVDIDRMLANRWQRGYEVAQKVRDLAKERSGPEVRAMPQELYPTVPVPTITPLQPSISERHMLMFMAQAFAIAERSYARDLKVGALLVSPQPDGTHRTISDGYNGTEPGTPNCCEDAHGNQLPGVIHAERNLFRKLMRSHESSFGCWLFVTRSPCGDCVERILDAGISAVFFCEAHRDDSPLKRLQSRGVYWKQVDKADMVRYFDSISQRLRQPKFNEV